MKALSITTALLCCLVTAYGESPIENSLHAKLNLDEVIGIRILRLPKGDNFSKDVVTFVSHDSKHCRAVNDHLKQLPPKGTWRYRSNPMPKREVTRRIVLINIDGREVSLRIVDDHLLGSFLNEGHAGAIISIIKEIERSAEGALKEMTLPTIDAVVTHYDSGSFPNAGANMIRVGDRVQLNLSELTTSRPFLNFTPDGESERRGWLAFPSAMSCEPVQITYNDSLHDAGYRLFSQHFNTDSLTKIEVLALGRNRNSPTYEITITHEESSFTRGFMRLTGHVAPAEAAQDGTALPEAPSESEEK